MKNEISIKKTVAVGELAKIFEDLAKSIREGRVCVETGKKFITLKPSENIGIEIEAEVKNNKEKMVIEMGWRRVEPEKEAETFLKISSLEPVAEPSEKEDVEDEDDKYSHG
jgi:amphi-Trp domain-containing protein